MNGVVIHVIFESLLHTWSLLGTKDGLVSEIPSKASHLAKGEKFIPCCQMNTFIETPLPHVLRREKNHLRMGGMCREAISS